MTDDRLTVHAHWFKAFHKDRIVKMEWDRKDSRAPQLHVSPGSTLVAAMGPYWSSYLTSGDETRSCYQDIYDMCDYANQECGLEVFFREFPDLCLEPFDAIGSMRNLAYMAAIAQGFEWILYIDNDCLPQRDTLVKLIQSHVPIVAPVIRFADGRHHDLNVPQLEAGKGLAVAGSTLLTCLLVKTAVFLPWATGGFWGNAIGDDEGYHFDKLYGIGHQLYIQTNAEVIALTPPHFPLEAVWPQRMQRVRDGQAFPVRVAWPAGWNGTDPSSGPS